MLRSTLEFTLILVLVLLFAIQPVTALKVENPIIMMDVMAGSSLKFPIAVSINTGDPAADYAIDVVGFGQSPGGSYSLLPAAADTGPYSARAFVTIDSPLIHLAPGQRKTFNATISVPQNVGEGGRYALISIHPTITTGSGQTSFTTAITVPVMLTVKSTALTHTGAITNLEVGEKVPDTPMEITTTLKNTGNHHYYGTFVNVTVTDSAGKVVASASTNPSIWALTPGNQMNLTTPVSATLTPGTYTVKSDAKVGTTLLASKSSSFTVSTPSAVQTPTASKTNAPGTIAPSGGTVTPETKTTTYTPLSITIIILALTVIVCISGMRRRV
jgi:hypothetical protein